MTQKEKKELKFKILHNKFEEANYPYFIQNEDKTTDIPINSMDCFRIHIKFKELTEKPDDDPTLWTPLHLCVFNLKDKTVVMDAKPSEILMLVRGFTYERPRGKDTLRADASNTNLKGEWPERCGEFAKLWGKTVKGDEWAYPSITEVVMGIYEHLMIEVEERLIFLKVNMPERF